VQPESEHIVSTFRLVQAVAVPVHLLPTQPQPSILMQAAELTALEHLLGVPEQLLVGPQPLSAKHSCADSVVHEAAVPLQTGAPPAPALATEPPEPPVAAPPEPAWPVLPPAVGVPAPPAVPVSPPETLIAPASPAVPELPPLLSIAPAAPGAPGAPAASLPGVPASPAAPGELELPLEPPQLTLIERAHGTSHSQVDFFMPISGKSRQDFIIGAVHNFWWGAPPTF
jgi:hypothetical protein